MNLVAALLGVAATTPDRPALVGAGATVSHGEVAARAAHAAALVGDRVSIGDRVALIAGNEPAFVTAYLGTLAAGAVAVPLNPAAPSQELAREFERRRAGIVARVERVRGFGAAREYAMRRADGCVRPRRGSERRDRSTADRSRARPTISQCCSSPRALPDRRKPRCSRTVRCSRTSSRCKAIPGCRSAPTMSRSACCRSSTFSD